MHFGGTADCYTDVACLPEAYALELAQHYHQKHKRPRQMNALTILRKEVGTVSPSLRLTEPWEKGESSSHICSSLPLQGILALFPPTTKDLCTPPLSASMVSLSLLLTSTTT